MTKNRKKWDNSCII